MKEMMKYEAEKLPQIICEEHPDWVRIYDAAWQMGFSNIEYPTKPGWKPQMTCMPGRGHLWQWDSCFMTFFSRFSNGTLGAMNNLDNLYRLSRDDGYMSMCYVIETEKEAYGERINPPLFSWSEWEYFSLTGDDSRFELVLAKLVKLFDWIKANRRRVSGLYWFEDSGSSGMDNCPRSGYLSPSLNGSDICHIDLACQQALNALCLSKIARHMGKIDLADRFLQEHEELRVLINERHWSERFGFYFDLFSRDSKERRHNFLNHKTAAGFWPMISEVANAQQLSIMMQHLMNPEEFNTLHPVPSLSKDDPNYSPFGEYWCGGVWAPTNYMVVKGLERWGKFNLARDICIKHLNAMVGVFNDEKYQSIWECYAPDYLMPAEFRVLLSREK